MSRRKRNKRRTRKYKGGLGDPRYTFFPQPIINIGRDSLAQGQDFMNARAGAPPSVSPSIMNQPINK